MFRFGAFQLDARQGLRRGDREIRITPKSLSLLCFLAERAGVIVSKEEIFQKIWPDTNVSDAALSSCIQELRSALHDDAKQPRFIETVHRRGYRFVASVLERKPAEVVRSRAVPFPACHAPIVGREHQIRQLENAWQLASQGVRQILFVSGHAGVGKTTTVLTFLTNVLDRSQARVTWGQCVQHFGAGEPYEPILDALNRLCHQQDGEQFVSIIERHGPTWLAQLPSLLPTERYLALQQAIAGTTRERMLRELTNTLETITAEKPFILWLEDLHWSDRSTLDWIVAFAQRPETARLLLIGTFRSSEVASTDHPLARFPDELQLRGQCGHIALTGLDEAAVESYITMRYPQWQGPTTINQLAQLVHAKTEGNPLFVINVLGELEGRNLIKEKDGAWALPDRISQQDLGVSLSLWRAIETQIERLGPEERNLLEVASVAGGTFASSTVAALAGVPAGEADELLRSLVRRQRLICFEEGLKAKRQETAQGFAFLHVLYQDALYKRISGRRLEDLHLRVGKIKQVEYGDSAKESAAELAMHFELGREFNLAIQYFEVAGKTARQRSAYTEARMHFDRAIALLRHVSDGPEKREREAILYAGLGGVLMATYGFGATAAESRVLPIPTLIRSAWKQCAAISSPMGFVALLLGAVFTRHSESNLRRSAGDGVQNFGPRIDPAGSSRGMGDRVFSGGNTLHVGTHVRRLASLRPSETLRDGKHVWRPRRGSVLPQFPSQSPHCERGDAGRRTNLSFRHSTCNRFGSAALVSHCICVCRFRSADAPRSRCNDKERRGSDSIGGGTRVAADVGVG